MPHWLKAVSNWLDKYVFPNHKNRSLSNRGGLNSPHRWGRNYRRSPASSADGHDHRQSQRAQSLQGKLEVPVGADIVWLAVKQLQRFHLVEGSEKSPAVSRRALVLKYAPAEFRWPLRLRPRRQSRLSRRQLQPAARCRFQPAQRQGKKGAIGFILPTCEPGPPCRCCHPTARRRLASNRRATFWRTPRRPRQRPKALPAISSETT